VSASVDPRYPNYMLRRNQAAAYVRDQWNFPCSSKTLAKLAVVGGGPVYRLAGRFPMYDTNDLDEWCRSRLGPKRRSTSERV
jgi:hypothetical protein